MNSVGFVSLGCAKNQVDAEMLLCRLRDAGYELVEDAGLADIAVVNTCCFIEEAKAESIQEILELSQLKAQGKIKKIVVTGCMAERYREEVLKEIPEVDAVIGLGSNGDIVSLLGQLNKNSRLQSYGKKESLPLEGSRLLTTPGYTAYLRIADGCDNCCSYCAIPSIRGGYRSRPMGNILAEAATLVEQGVKELVVIAQDITRYGSDIYGRLELPVLLKSLCENPGLQWVRLLYCYPDYITDELIDVMAAEQKIVKYMDLPLQHCNEDILKRMNRNGNRESLTALIRKVRERVPGIVLRSTFIVGFPGETEEQFTELCEFVEENAFERMGCFAYSPEEDTPAAEFPDQIDPEIKNARQEVLSALQQRIMEQNSVARVGAVLEVLNEGYDRVSGCYFGRSYGEAPEVDPKVFFTIKKNNGIIPPGTLVNVEITDSLDIDLIGTVC